MTTEPHPAPYPGAPYPDARVAVDLTVNGIPRQVEVPARRLLSDCLRHDPTYRG